MDETTYHFDIREKEDHLEIFIPELHITVSTQPGETSRDAALDAVHAAIEQHVMAARSAASTTAQSHA